MHADVVKTSRSTCCAQLVQKRTYSYSQSHRVGWHAATKFANVRNRASQSGDSGAERFTTAVLSCSGVEDKEVAGSVTS